MNIGYIASTKQGSVLYQITDEIPKYGKHPICQTSVRQHNKLYNKGNPLMRECQKFTSKLKSNHIVDLNTNTLHIKECKKTKDVTNMVSARIVNAKTTGLKLCRCCK